VRGALKTVGIAMGLPCRLHFWSSECIEPYLSSAHSWAL